jgi:hypothetical protein
MAMKPLADDLQLTFPCQGLAAFLSASEEPGGPYNSYSFYMNGVRMSITEAGFDLFWIAAGLVRFIFIGYDENRNRRVAWIPSRVTIVAPYDTPMPESRANNANLLRLWSAEGPKSFDFDDFNVGVY